MASSSSARIKPVLVVAVSILLTVIALPEHWKTWAPAWLKPDFHLGLDLAGGTQLDFRISEDEIRRQLEDIDREIAALEAQGATAEQLDPLRRQRTLLSQQSANLVEAIRTVLERRINALGVSEATITPSYVGNEKHLLVECPGVVDVQECIETVGKTIQLEFKEQFTEPTEEYEDDVRATVAAARNRLSESGMTLAILGEDMQDDLGVAYIESRAWFRDELPPGMQDLWTQSAGPAVLEREGSIPVQQQNDQGQLVTEDVPGIFLAQILAPPTMTGRVIQETSAAFELLARTESGVTQEMRQNVSLDTLPATTAAALRTMQPGELRVVPMENESADLLFLRLFTPGEEVVEVSHILVGYQGAEAAEPNVTRSKEEALAKAADVKRRIEAGASFEDLARAESDGPSRANAGKLDPVHRGDVVPAFEEVAFSQEPGIISEPLETPFGYHLIRVDKAPEKTADTASFAVLTVNGPDAQQRATDYRNRMQNGEILQEEEAVTIRALFFSLLPTGWKDTPLDGKHFRSATVVTDPTTNQPLVQITFDSEGGRLFQELTKANIGKPIAIFVGGQLVSAPTVQQEITGGTAVITGSQTFQESQALAQDLNTGAIPAPIHVTGQRTVEATLGAEALRTSLAAALAGMAVLMLYMLVVYRMLGLLANVALIIYAILFVAILKLPLFLVSDTYIVLTLAGAAGVILSIGMAVDTNVLVFERVKEELKAGKTLRTAVETGYKKAWPSIRDSNISTFITCALLFLIGTSIVRGFAVTLGMGVIISMFTGIIVSRWLSRRLARTALADKPGLYPGMKA